MAYEGSVELISGIKQANNGTFPLVDASAVRVADNKRLDAALNDIGNDKANVADPVFTGSVSMGRDSSSTTGTKSVATGNNVTASGSYSHAEGEATIASGNNAHAEGESTIAYGYDSHAEGKNTVASNRSQHVFGEFNKAPLLSGVVPSYRGSYVEIVGNGTAANARSNARALDWNGNEYLKGDLYIQCDTESDNGLAVGVELAKKVDKASPEFTGPVSMGRKEETTVGQNSVAIGYNVEASEMWTHAEGVATKATAYYAHAEGSETTASGERSHAEGSNTIASGTASHAEGRSTVASNIYSHAEGLSSKATGSYSHAEGSSESHGTYSHAEGYDTKTNGEYSHSEGKGTIANGWYSHAAGMYNIPSSGVWSRTGMTSEYESDHAYVYGDFAYIREVTQDSRYHFTFYVCIEDHISGSTLDPSKWYVIYDRVSVLDQVPDFWYWPEAEIIGNGLDEDNRANARVLSWTGDEFLRGDLYIHCDADSSNGKKVATQEYVEALEARIAALEAAIQNS